MNWVLLSFAVITPMSASIGMAFTRRDQALGHMAVIKATLLNIYSAHACWDWYKPNEPSGRTLSSGDVDWLEHSDKALRAILEATMELTRLLTLPNSSRARHRVTSAGAKEANDINSLAFKLLRLMFSRLAKLTALAEVLMQEGLPPPLTTRIRAWERLTAERIGKQTL